MWDEFSFRPDPAIARKMLRLRDFGFIRCDRAVEELANEGLLSPGDFDAMRTSIRPEDRPAYQFLVDHRGREIMLDSSDDQSGKSLLTAYWAEKNKGPLVILFTSNPTQNGHYGWAAALPWVKATDSMGTLRSVSWGSGLRIPNIVSSWENVEHEFKDNADIIITDIKTFLQSNWMVGHTPGMVILDIQNVSWQEREWFTGLGREVPSTSIYVNTAKFALPRKTPGKVSAFDFRQYGNIIEFVQLLHNSPATTALSNTNTAIIDWMDKRGFAVRDPARLLEIFNVSTHLF